MSQIFVIEDLTAGKTFYESGKMLLDAIFEHSEKDKVPFFTRHGFDPEGDHYHRKLATNILNEFEYLHDIVSKLSEDQRFGQWSKSMSLEFFQELVEYCKNNPNNLFTCYIEP